MWRFRKIFNFGAFRTSVSKSGVGYSYGLFGFRFGVSPNGRKYISFGIPGTGLYFIKYLNNNTQNRIYTQNNSAAQTPQTTKLKGKQKVEWWKQKDLDKF